MPDVDVDRLESILADAQSERRMPSVVAAAFRDGEVVWERAIGLANVSDRDPATTAHAYRIGSITKTFTAVALLRLRDDGLLDLDDRLADHVDGVPAGPTLRQVLSHASGLQRETPGAMWETMTPPTREELLASLGDCELVARPGRLWHYSNLAFALLGEIVARHGTTYEQVLRALVLDPLGLERTRLRPAAPAAIPYFVEPYTDRARVEPDPEVTELTGAAGWLWSTVGDLAGWADFLCTGRDGVLARETLDEMASVHAMLDADWTAGWGLGVELVRRDDRVFVGHLGAMPGFMAGLYVERETRCGAVVLANSGAGVRPGELTLRLAATACDGFARAAPVWRPSDDVPDDVIDLLGRWWTEGEEVVISWRAGTLRAELVGGLDENPLSILERDGVDAWRVVRGREHGERLVATRDDSGAVTRVTFVSYPLTRHPSTFG